MSISTVKTWRERISQPADFPLHAPTDVERAMEAEIAELRGRGGRLAELLDANELAALRRFNETCEDGEGYDVPKEMMQRLAGIGAVRRTSGSYYEITDFGMHVLEQPAPVPVEVLTVPKAVMDIKVDQFQSDEYKRGHRDARHAAADVVLELADKLAALATSNIDQKGCAS